MVIREALKEGLPFLENREYTNPLLEVRVILAHFLQKDQSYLVAHEEEVLSDVVEQKYFHALLRRKRGEPLQYILGETEFMMRDFYVDCGVLIPRNDTEISAETVINLIRKNHLKSFLEIGCGSGIVAITVALDTEVEVVAADISHSALEITKKNCRRYQLSFPLIQSDLFENIQGSFDIIYSNPPYIPTRDIEQLQEEVKSYEPRLALDGGEDGLDVYRRLLQNIDPFLNSKGFIVLEIGYNQANSVKQLMWKYNTYVIKDYHGLDRVIVGQKE